MDRTRDCAVVVITALLVCFAVPAPVLGTPSADASPDNHDPLDSASALQADENNSTSHHVNPENASESGDLLDVRGWLTTRLAAQLGDSAVQISQGQYELGREVIGDQYDSRLGQLIDVVGDTETGDDDDLGDTFSHVQDSQRNYSDTAQEYNETYDAYEEAVESGNESEARRHGRRLQELESQVQDLNQTLIDQYEHLENRTGTDFSDATESISNHSHTISAQQRDLERELFTPTTLDVSTDSETIAYDEPLVARGQLLSDDGTPIANQTVTIQVYTQTKDVHTDSDGRFTVRYRPRILPVNTSSVTVTYLPAGDSAYLGSNATVPVTVEQVAANLSLQSVPATVSFADRFEIAATLTLDGQRITGVPLDGRLGNYRLDPQETDGGGTGVFTGRLPATIPQGEQDVVVSVAHENRAISAPSLRGSTRVQLTDTNLTLRGERTGSDAVRIDGQLQTSDGQVVPGQPISVAFSNGSARTVETARNGQFSLVVNQSALPNSQHGTAAVTASFDGRGTNLRSTSLTKELQFDSVDNQAPDNQGASQPAGSEPLPLAILLGVPVVVGIVLIWWRRNTENTTQQSDDADPGHSEHVPDAGPVALDLTHGRSLVSDGRSDDAVQYVYHTVRGFLAPSVSSEESDTHWEFFDKCQEHDLEPAQRTALRELVETYEHTRFFETEPAAADVEALIETIEAHWQ